MDMPSIDVSASVVYHVTTKVASSASGSLVTTAFVNTSTGFVDSATSNNIATTSNSITRYYDLSVTKTDGLSIVAAGANLTYSIAIFNFGPSDAYPGEVSVTDIFPPEITLYSTWSCIPSANAICSTDTWTGNSGTSSPTLPKGENILLVAKASVAQNVFNVITNTASVSSSLDSNISNNNETDADPVIVSADVIASLNSSPAPPSTVSPGAIITYSLFVQNLGPSDIAASRVTILDIFPPTLLNTQWSCQPLLGVSKCSATGSSLTGTGDISLQPQIPNLGQIQIVVTAQIISNATGTVSNWASVLDDSGVNDPSSANDYTITSISLVPNSEIQISKSNGLNSVSPGQTITYDIIVSNLGPADIQSSAITVIDYFPPDFIGSWTCLPDIGSSCPAGGSPPITLSPYIKAKTNVTILVTGSVKLTAVGTLNNTASVDVDPLYLNSAQGDSSTDSDILQPVVNLQLSASYLAFTAGATDSFITVTITNNGPAIAPIQLNQSASAFVKVACAAPVSICSLPSASGLLNNFTLTLNPGGSYSILQQVYLDPSLTVFSLTYWAVSSSPISVIDNGGDMLVVNPNVVVTPGLSLDIESGTPTSIVLGELLVFVFVITNRGPSTASPYIELLHGGQSSVCFDNAQLTCKVQGNATPNTSLWTLPLTANMIPPSYFVCTYRY